MAFGGIIGRQTTTYTNEEIDGMIQQAVSNKAIIETGSYVGKLSSSQTGSNTNCVSIHFTYEPYLFFVYQQGRTFSNSNAAIIFPQALFNNFSSNLMLIAPSFSASYDQFVAKYENKILSYYLSGGYDFNYINTQYNWFAICSV